MNLVGDTGAEHGSLFFITIPDKQHKLIAQTDLEILFRGGTAQYIGHFQKDGIGKEVPSFSLSWPKLSISRSIRTQFSPSGFSCIHFWASLVLGLLIPYAGQAVTDFAFSSALAIPLIGNVFNDTHNKVGPPVFRPGNG